MNPLMIKRGYTKVTMAAKKYRKMATYLLSGWLLIVAWQIHAQVTPLPQAHSHNDYEREHPLADALAHGFTSVEADILYIYGELFVGHNMPDHKRHKLKTLEKQYLKPLYRRYVENNGEIYPGYAGPFYLWIDIKFESRKAYLRLRETLLPYKDMLSHHENGEFRPGKVTVILSGERPFRQLLSDPLQLMTLDGRPDDLTKDYPTALMPFISQHFLTVLALSEGESYEAEQTSLSNVRQLAEQARSQGKKVRLWATPEEEALWKKLLQLDIGLINTDDLPRLQSFLVGRN